MGRKVAIVGAALSDCGRVDDKTAFELHHQATDRALADAGISRNEVDGFMSHGHRDASADRARRVPRARVADQLHRLDRGRRIVLGDVPRARSRRDRRGTDRDGRPLVRVDLRVRT